jgi:peroxiredoxin
MKNLKTISLIFSILVIFNNFGCAQSADTLPDARGFMVKIGEITPDFTIQFPDGSPSKKLSDLRGNVVMLQFTASWCSVCIKEMPHIEKEIWQVFKDKGLYVFGVDRKETKEQAIKFVKKAKVTYPIIMDENGGIFELYAHSKAGVTRNVLIDKTGKIVFMTRLYDKDEFEQLVKKIQEIL